MPSLLDEHDWVADGGEFTPGRLAREIGRALRRERELAQLTQAELSLHAGVSQQMIALLEGGKHRPTTVTVERVFAGLGRQLKVVVEDLDADVDAAVTLDPDDAASDKRLFTGSYETLLRWMGGLDHRLEGALAAAHYGVPARVASIDFVVADVMSRRSPPSCAKCPTPNAGSRSDPTSGSLTLTPGREERSDGVRRSANSARVWSRSCRRL